MNDGTGDASQLGDVDAVAFIRSARDDFTEEDDFATFFGNSDVHATDARQHLSNFDEFVVVSGEEGTCATTFVVVQIFDDGTSDGEAIIGAGAAPNFIEDDEATRGSVMVDVRSFDHFDHESA